MKRNIIAGVLLLVIAFVIYTIITTFQGADTFNPGLNTKLPATLPK